MLIFGKKSPPAGHKIHREIAGWLIALTVAFLLPCFLDPLPSWLIPGQWSNLAFWQSLWETLQERWREQLVFPGSVFLGWQKELLWKDGLCSIMASVCLSVVLYQSSMKSHSK